MEDTFSVLSKYYTMLTRDIWRQPWERLPFLIHGAIRARTVRASFGRRPYMRGRIFFSLRGKAVFGDHFEVWGVPVGVNIKVGKGAVLTTGHNFFMNFGASIETWHETRIGNKVMLAPYASIIDHNRHEVEPGAVLVKGPVVIGNNVWIGRNAAIMPGVSIGNGCVIAANSVVTKDIPPNSFVAGSPARVIRELAIPDGWVRM